MKKILFGLLIGVMLLNSCHSSVPVRRDRERPPLETAIRATVALIHNRAETSADQTAQVFCSGFFISNRTIVSALHCFQEMRIVRIGNMAIQLPTRPNPVGDVVQFVRYGDIDMLDRRFINDIVNEARVVHVDPVNDLAILELQPGTTSSNAIMTLQLGSLNVAQRVYLLGHPLELVWSLVDGIISRNVVSHGRITAIQASIPLVGGFSGGPLMLPNGRVIGLASSYVGSMHHLSMFIPSRQIANALFRYEMNRTH